MHTVGHQSSPTLEAQSAASPRLHSRPFPNQLLVVPRASKKSPPAGSFFLYNDPEIQHVGDE